MRIKISFKNYSDIPIRNQKEMNSYIHRCIGKDNKYHDSFSEYSISSIQGGKLNMSTNMIHFDDEPYIYISSMDSEFMSKFIEGAMNTENKFFGMYFSKITIADFNVGKYCDTILTLSPILLKRNSDGRKITADDPSWIEELQKQCYNKLTHSGIKDKSFHIELRNQERAKNKMIYVGNVFNPCSHVSLKVYGKKKSRELLYTIGLGNSCGSGFGCVKLYD